MNPPAAEALAFIGLGSNLGDRTAQLEAAVEAIAALPACALGSRSSLYESAPVAASGDDYVNAVVSVRTTLAPIALLQALLEIEAGHGRRRDGFNAPRTLDLDLLLYGEIEMATPALTLPHPRLAERAFVLVPLAEIAPDLHVPGQGGVASLLGGVAHQRIAKLIR